jgi:hypothetical protein
MENGGSQGFRKMRCYIAGCVSTLVLVFFIGSLASSSFGQAVSGDIIGTITDPSGAAVSGGQITVENAGTSVSTQVTANESGNYTVANLTPGTYTLTITKPGFQKFIQQNVNVTISQSTGSHGHSGASRA